MLVYLIILYLVYHRKAPVPRLVSLPYTFQSCKPILPDHGQSLFSLLHQNPHLYLIVLEGTASGV